MTISERNHAMKLIWIIFELLNVVICYKPVVLVHGIQSDGGELNRLKNFIQEAHPGTNVTILKYLKDITTLEPLPLQLEIFNRRIDAVLKESHAGIHLICHSQGNLSK